ncbi:MAG: N-acetylmuramoyl-L-alanine amidase [Clostridia bacterium]|nr:N-acetylmuramoyl-L-alanine amidase [Clostridia bacterium]
MTEKRPFLYTLKFGIVIAITAAIVLCVGFAFTKHFESKKTDTSLPVFNKDDKIRFVIDPGHGGEDAGAVAYDGTLEKDLNLEIGTLLHSVLELNGKEAVLTRTTDTLLYDRFDDLNDYTGQKKVYDLKNRLKIAEEKENSIYVGIHMNKFPVEKYSGLQVYYSQNTELSQDIADDIKNTVSTYLQPNNQRQVKRATASIYILHNAHIPAVLIECGFLSNEKELASLKDKDYQKLLALNLFASLIEHGN